MTDQEALPSQGPVAGKYELVRMIGRGGMGSVWEARHVSLGTPSAIKFIESEFADSEEARSRFDKEAKAAATIQSKHAIQIYDHGVTEDGKPYIVMELLQGEPLDRRIDRLRQLTLQDTARILQQVCRGLARAHERGIVHRDLKPENIFLVRTPDDDEEVAKVLDFGIAKMSNGPGNTAASSSTKTGAVLGTPFYMSPEQARGLRNLDHRTDVWSLGVIAFKCVTGRLPFDGESIGDLLVKICTAPVPVPSQVLPGLPPNFDAWFLRALDRDPERRFPNVTELADALCFVAGIAPRSSAQGAPFSLGVPVVQGLGTGPVAPLRGSQPSGLPTPAAYGTGQPHGAMTNSPLTSATGGATASRGKVVAGGVLAGLVAAGVVAIAATAGVVYMVKRPHGAVAVTVSDSTLSVTDPARPNALAATPPAEAPAVKEATVDAGAEATAAAEGDTDDDEADKDTATSRAGGPRLRPKKASKAPSAPASATAPPATAPPATAPPATAPPATAPPVKKPSPDDPGY